MYSDIWRYPTTQVRVIITLLSLPDKDHNKIRNLKKKPESHLNLLIHRCKVIKETILNGIHD